MASYDDDLTGGPFDPLAFELRVANAKITKLMSAHRKYVDAFGRLALAAGVLSYETIEDVVNAIVLRLLEAAPKPSVEDLCSPQASEGSDAVCVICGAPGAVDFDGELLCLDCSGESAIAEAKEMPGG
jgi:hypothetical protein